VRPRGSVGNRGRVTSAETTDTGERWDGLVNMVNAKAARQAERGKNTKDRLTLLAMDARLRPERGYQENADKILASLSAVFYADGIQELGRCSAWASQVHGQCSDVAVTPIEKELS
jgi:hypothetical protein